MSADPLTLAVDTLAAWSVPHPDPLEYYDRGEWKIARSPFSVAYAQGGAASASALAWMGGAEKNACHYKMAIATIDFALNTYLHDDGRFYGPGATSPGIDTMMFANEFGTALVVLEHRLDAARKDWYKWAMTKMADVTAYNAKWWSNGNINAGYLATLYLAWRLTGAARFKTAYNQQAIFLVNSDVRSPGCGLVLTKAPKLADGSDGAGYLTESNQPNGVGFDPEYTQTQLDVLTRLYVLNGEMQILRLVNLLTNQLLGHLKAGAPGGYQIDKTGGSRHPTGTVAMTTPALDVLSRHGRTSLDRSAVEQWFVIDAAYRATFKYAAGENWIKTLGGQVGTMILDRLYLPPVKVS